MPIAQSSSKAHVSTKSMHKKCESESEKPVVEQTNSGVKTPPDQPEFIKQTMIIIEKKARNLDKRRQKLEEYKASERKGVVLNEDQLLAVSKYEEVMRTLELSRELEKQFVTLANDTMKQQKKQAKKEQLEKEEQAKERLRETYKYFTVLEKFADDVIRSHFLAETNGAIKLSQDELELLDAFDKLVAPGEVNAKLDAASSEFADHLYNLMEGKNKPINSLNTNTTYAELKKLFERVLAAPYWTEKPKQPEQAVEVEQAVEGEKAVVAGESLCTPVENMQLNEQQQHDNEQASYQNTNVEDYVIVSSSECAESLCHSKSPSLQPQQHIFEQPQHQDDQQQQQQESQKTFFTTLNQPEQRNINEFINSCENNDAGINFFQDSELQSRQQKHAEQTEIDFNAPQQNQPQEQNQFNQQQQHRSNDLQKDNKYQQRGPREQNSQRPYQQQQRGDRRYPDDRRSTNNNNSNTSTQQQAPRQDNRGSTRPQQRGGASSGAPRDGQSSNPRGPYRGGQSNGGNNSGQRSNNNGPRNTNNYQQQSQPQQQAQPQQQQQ